MFKGGFAALDDGAFRGGRVVEAAHIWLFLTLADEQHGGSAPKPLEFMALRPPAGEGDVTGNALEGGATFQSALNATLARQASRGLTAAA